MLATAASLDTGQTEAARRAEAAGFDGVYVGDHLLHPHPLLESVVTLAAVAASTGRISLGPCVMLLALRHPVVLAKQLGTLSAFAPGRLRVGVGVGGEYPAEFEAAGVPLPERGRRMESALRQVRSLLTDGTGHPGVTIGPGAPEVPFLLAGWKEVSLRRAAAHGDGWIGTCSGRTASPGAGPSCTAAGRSWGEPPSHLSPGCCCRCTSTAPAGPGPLQRRPGPGSPAPGRRWRNGCSWPAAPTRSSSTCTGTGRRAAPSSCSALPTRAMATSIRWNSSAGKCSRD